jgi:hypothetical protein
MLLNNHTALWKKIREFPLNEPGAAITFSNKLQEQQEWSASYTERVIEEYRKFIFLCTVAPKGASPSKAVDEAWHLHLTYTKSYWIDLCKNTLGRDLHHHPSKGGNDEDHKHEEWYKETLEFYRQAFGTEPPSDIWPPPLDANTPIPEPNFPVTNQEKWVYGVLLLLPFIFALLFFGQMIPFLLNGPDFLWFFPIFIFSLIGIYVLMRMKRRKFYRHLVYDVLHEDIDFYDKIDFLYGRHRAVQAAIVDLVRRELLKVHGNKDFIVSNSNIRRSPTETNPLFEGLIRETDGEMVYYDDIAAHWYTERPVHPLLQNLREFAYRPEPVWTLNWVWIVTLIAGFLRMMQGLVNDRPVSYLFVETLLLVVLSLIMRQLFLRRIVIYKWVEEVFEQQAFNGPLHKDDVVNNFALRGNPALTLFSDGLILASFFSGYEIMNHSSFFGPMAYKPYGSGGSGGGGCGSTCGGGGGSSCGGGGCGGCGGGGGD